MCTVRAMCLIKPWLHALVVTKFNLHAHSAGCLRCLVQAQLFLPRLSAQLQPSVAFQTQAQVKASTAVVCQLLNPACVVRTRQEKQGQAVCHAEGRGRFLHREGARSRNDCELQAQYDAFTRTSPAANQSNTPVFPQHSASRHSPYPPPSTHTSLPPQAPSELAPLSTVSPSLASILQLLLLLLVVDVFARHVHTFCRPGEWRYKHHRLLLRKLNMQSRLSRRLACFNIRCVLTRSCFLTHRCPALSPSLPTQ